MDDHSLQDFFEAELKKVQAASAIVRAAEDSMKQKHGEAITALLGAMAQASFIYSASVCAAHGTPECTCDPKILADRGVRGLQAMLENVNSLLNTVLPILKPDVDFTAMVEEVKTMFVAIEKAYAIIHPEEAEMTPDGEVDPAAMMPGSGTLQ
jgi:hypothetical protein